MSIKKRRSQTRANLGSCSCFLTRSLALSTAMAKKKNPHAVALGRLGGLKGGKARFAKLTPEERREVARKAVLARWAKEKANRQVKKK